MIRFKKDDSSFGGDDVGYRKDDLTGERDPSFMSNDKDC